ncbi:hypothetical protein OHA37_37600 [Streptomyces sp. NBC_00335]|nr:MULTISPECIES: hypothetical protein [unclassified Streptomyces]MCX5409561.1 hypothetical protein [Streptomyces sp. NBC_00086]
MAGPYVVSLSLIAERLALLTLGLVRPRSERLPDGVPFAGHHFFLRTDS